MHGGMHKEKGKEMARTHLPTSDAAAPPPPLLPSRGCHLTAQTGSVCRPVRTEEAYSGLLLPPLLLLLLLLMPPARAVLGVCVWWWW